MSRPRPPWRPRTAPSAAAAAAALLLVVLAGCGSTPSAPSAAPPAAHHPPELHRFLQLPPATPTACPRGANAATVGRVSPWTGTVDVSVFLRPTLTRSRLHALRDLLRRQPQVSAVYYESARQAHAEFARLYTCSASVPLAATPASFRLVLGPQATVGSRDDLVARLLTVAGVATISCDPSAPCTAVVRSASPAPSR